MPTSKRRIAAFAAAVAVILGPAGAAQGYVEPGAQLLSGSLATLEQADDATGQVAVSGDGRFDFFSTPARNLFPAGAKLAPKPVPGDSFVAGGIFRRRFSDGSLDLVAPGDLRPKSAPGTTSLRGALNVSSSSTGRYVVFSTGWPLVPEDTNGAIDVYVRDMDKPIDAAGAFDLVSALDSGSTPASWDSPFTDRPGRNPGADVSAGRAISADGTKVVFKTDILSDLPAGASFDTPRGQVLLRDRVLRTTTIVSRNNVDGGPVGTSEFGPDPFNLARNPVISADGSSVAWVGRNAPTQVHMLAGESLDAQQDYIYFRRVADGPAAVTTRLLTVTDPDDPSCGDGFRYVPDFYATGPCYGPLGEPENYYGGLNYMIPSLSADGSLALLTTNGPARAQLGQGNSPDAWLVSTSPTKSRKSAALELTRDSNLSHAGDPINSATLSADGKWALLVTARSVFTLPTLSQSDSPRLNATKSELYMVDIEKRTIERVLRTPQGGDIDGSVFGTPAISDDGRVIAFVSDATNLFLGDSNQAPDAFGVLRTDPPDTKPPVDPEPKALNAALVQSRSASVRLSASLPAAGALSVQLIGRLPADKGRPARDVALGKASIWTARSGRRTIDVKVASKWLSTLRALRSVSATAALRFVDVDGAPYVVSVPVTVVR